MDFPQAFGDFTSIVFSLNYLCFENQRDKTGIAILDKHQIHEPIKEDTIGDKFLRECGLLAGMAERMPTGIINAVDDAFKHPQQSAFAVGMSAAMGVGLALLAKNPGLAGKAVEPFIKGGLDALPAIAGVTVSCDLGQRLGEPIMATWNSLSNFEINKKQLADKFGVAAVDYTLMGLGGLAGAKYGPAAMGKIAYNFGELVKPQNNMRFAFASESPKQMHADVFNPNKIRIEDNEYSLLMKGQGFDGCLKTSVRGPVKIGSKPTPDVIPAVGEGNVILYPHEKYNYACAKIFTNGRWYPLDLPKILKVDDTKFVGDVDSSLKALAERLQKLENSDLVLKERTNEPVFKHFTLENTELQISGKVTIDRANLKPAAPEKGDVYIRVIIRDGIRTQDGKSGRIYTQIFDGNSWQRFNAWNFREGANWSYECKSIADLEANAKSIKEHIIKGKNQTVSWTQGTEKFHYR